MKLFEVEAGRRGGRGLFEVPYGPHMGVYFNSESPWPPGPTGRLVNFPELTPGRSS